MPRIWNYFRCHAENMIKKVYGVKRVGRRLKVPWRTGKQKKIHFSSIKVVDGKEKTNWSNKFFLLDHI